MELLFTIVKYAFLGFFGLLGLLVVGALLFGKRMITKWEYEAEFRDGSGREFGEFDIEMSRIEKDEPEFSLKAEFRMRHAALTLHKTVQVFLDDVLVLQGMVTSAGRIRLTHRENLQNRISDAAEGQVCRVVCGGTELFREALVVD